MPEVSYSGSDSAKLRELEGGRGSENKTSSMKELCKTWSFSGQSHTYNAQMTRHLMLK